MICPRCNKNNDDYATYCHGCGARLDGQTACPKCGSFNRRDAVYCVKCGTRLDGKRFCKTCGTELHDGDVYCPKCGVRLSSTAQSVATVGASAGTQTPATPVPTCTPSKGMPAGVHTPQTAPPMSTQPPVKQAVAIGFSKAHTVFGIALALVSTLFMFLMQFGKEFFYAYFGSAYDTADAALKTIVGTVSRDSVAVIKQATYTPLVFGTIISAIVMAGVLTCAILTVVRAVRYTYFLRGNDDGGDCALGAFLIYIAGIILLGGLNNVHATGTVMATRVQNGLKLGGATVAGLIVTGIFAAAYVGTTLYNRQPNIAMRSIGETIALTVGILCAIAMLIVAALPSITVKDSSDTLRWHAPFLNEFMSGLTYGSGAEKALGAAKAMQSATVWSEIFLLLLVLSSVGLLLRFWMRLTADGFNNPPRTFWVAIVMFLSALLFLIFAVSVARQCKEIFEAVYGGTGGYASSSYIVSAIPVTAIVLLVLAIVQLCAVGVRKKLMR